MLLGLSKISNFSLLFSSSLSLTFIWVSLFNLIIPSAGISVLLIIIPFVAYMSRATRLF